jgi:hypothetical protein
MTGFYEGMKQGDKQFFKDAARACVRYKGRFTILGVVQPHEKGEYPAPGGMASGSSMRVDVLNSDVQALEIGSGSRIEVLNLQGDWEPWMVDFVRPNAWTAALLLMPSSGQRGMTAEF